MKKQLIALLSLPFLFFSCEKDDINVTLNQSGTINVKVIDNDNKGIDGAMVTISYSSYSDAAYEGKTNSSGICKTDKLLQGIYDCYAQVTYNNVPYYDSKSVQVIAGENKTVEINPISNAGTAIINVRPYYGSINVAGLNVALIPYYQNIESIEKIKGMAHFIGKTNSNGTVQITDIPASVEYRVYVYDDNTVYRNYNGYFYIRKGHISEFTVEIYTY